MSLAQIPRQKAGTRLPLFGSHVLSVFRYVASPTKPMNVKRFH